MVPIAPHFFNTIALDPPRYNVDVGAQFFSEAHLISLSLSIFGQTKRTILGHLERSFSGEIERGSSTRGKVPLFAERREALRVSKP